MEKENCKKSNKKKLKILFLADDKFPPFRVDVAVLFGSEMTERGHEIDWLLQAEKDSRKALKTIWQSCRAYIGPADNRRNIVWRVKNHFLRVMNDFSVFKLLKNNTYNCVIVRDKFFTAMIPLFASLLYERKFIFWLSYPFPEESLYRVKDGTAPYPLYYYVRGHLFKLILYRIILPLSKHIFVQTDRMKNNLVKKGVYSSKMTSIPMAVSVKEIPFIGYKHPIDYGSRKKIIVYLGTLVRTRKMEFLIRVFANLLEKEKEALLYLVGGSKNPSDEKFLKDEARKLGVLELVKITGFLPQKKALRFVEIADVCVSPIFPSPILNLGSPTKLLEYMAMGKASVANDHPEQKKVMRESGSGICVPWKEEEFSKAIIYLLNNPYEAEQMGIRGRKYIEDNRNYKNVAAIVEKKLIEICFKKS